MSLKKIKIVEETVLDVLLESEEARRDDFILISKTLEKTNPETVNMTIEQVLLNSKKLGIPSFASITRARRKLFKKYPQLCPEDIKRNRKNEAEQYKKYSKE